MSWLEREADRAATSKWPTWPMVLLYLLIAASAEIIIARTEWSSTWVYPPVIAVVMLGLWFLLARLRRRGQQPH